LSVLALVLAAGDDVLPGGLLPGSTMAARPVPFVRVGGVPLVVHAVRTLLSSGVVDRVIVRIGASHVDATRRLFATESDRVGVLPGRDTASFWVFSSTVRTVVVHDVTRPLTPPSLVAAVVVSAEALGAIAAPVLPVSDTIKRVDLAGRVLGAADRSQLREVQTPLAFPAAQLRRAGEVVMEPGSGLIDQLDGPVHTVPGDPLAFRIRSAWDLRVAESLVCA
jgi:2-C-methyl-D-erythritol 4-phosphate cytidylyltransferase